MISQIGANVFFHDFEMIAWEPDFTAFENKVIINGYFS